MPLNSSNIFSHYFKEFSTPELESSILEKHRAEEERIKKKEQEDRELESKIWADHVNLSREEYKRLKRNKIAFGIEGITEIKQIGSEEPKYARLHLRELHLRDADPAFPRVKIIQINNDDDKEIYHIAPAGGVIVSDEEDFLSEGEKRISEKRRRIASEIQEEMMRNARINRNVRIRTREEAIAEIDRRLQKEIEEEEDQQHRALTREQLGDPTKYYEDRVTAYKLTAWEDPVARERADAMQGTYRPSFNLSQPIDPDRVADTVKNIMQKDLREVNDEESAPKETICELPDLRNEEAIQKHKKIKKARRLDNLKALFGLVVFVIPIMILISTTYNLPSYVYFIVGLIAAILIILKECMGVRDAAVTATTSTRAKLNELSPRLSENA